MWKYKDFFSSTVGLEKLTLGEGYTPLIKSKWIGPSLGLENLYFKLETVNPTGSYKDRFASLALANIRRRKGKICLATSSGNTGAALAAYAAALGIPCKVAIVDGAPYGKLRQMQIYGADLFMVKDFGIDGQVTSDTFDTLSKIAVENATEIQVSAYEYSALGMEGVETISFEISEDLPSVKHVFAPAGGGGLTLAIAKGFEKWKDKHPNVISPKVHCVQPTGNNTIAGNLRNGILEAQSIEKSTTKISGLQVANVIDGHQTIAACRLSGGTGFLVDDASVYRYQRLLATKEGIYTEPAGAVALTALTEALDHQTILKKDPTIVIITGSGFKDNESSDQMVSGLSIKKITDLTTLASYFN
nr:pyridoxal-phosphate dependent enzyme [Cytophagales bacterium]